MIDNRQDTILPIGNAAVTLHARGERHRLRLESACIVPRGRGRVRLTLDGPQGSILVNLPLTHFLHIASTLDEQSSAAGLPAPLSATTAVIDTLTTVVNAISADPEILGLGGVRIVRDFPVHHHGQASMLLEGNADLFVLDL